MRLGSSHPCPPGCTCGRHKGLIPWNKGSTCPDGCSCGRHANHTALDGYAVVLTTENGCGPTNTIVLEPEVARDGGLG